MSENLDRETALALADAAAKCLRRELVRTGAFDRVDAMDLAFASGVYMLVGSEKDMLPEGIPEEAFDEVKQAMTADSRFGPITVRTIVGAASAYNFPSVPDFIERITQMPDAGRMDGPTEWGKWTCPMCFKTWELDEQEPDGCPNCNVALMRFRTLRVEDMPDGLSLGV